MDQNQKKQYTAEISLTLFADSDSEARDLLRKIARFLRKQDDTNQATPKSLTEIICNNRSVDL